MTPRMHRSTEPSETPDQGSGVTQPTSVPTMMDVATAAGVSTATVSRVLNGTGVVSEAMQNRVMVAIKQLGFQLNPIAQGLRKGQSNTVALLVGDIEQTHFSAMTKQVQGHLESIGLDLLLFNVGHSHARLEHFLKRVVSMRLRGVIVALSDKLSSNVIDMLRKLPAHGVVVVAIGQNLSGHRIASVVQSERDATVAAVRYLIERGRKRIAYLGRIKGSAVGTERYEGYKEALSVAQMYDPELVWDVSYRYSAGWEAIEKAYQNGIEFDAVQTGSDEMAIGAMAALKDRNVRIPEDVAVIGFGDVEMGAYVRPALTTVSNHPADVGVHVSQLFNASLSAKASLLVIQRSLLLRESA